MYARTYFFYVKHYYNIAIPCPLGPLAELAEPKSLQDYGGDAHSVEEAIQGRPRHGRGMLPLQALLQEVGGGVLLLGSLGE